MTYDTKILREAGKAALAAAGMPVEPVTSGHGANQLYKIREDAERNPGKLVRLRTNNRWAIMDYATGPDVNAPIEQLEGVDFVCGVCVNPESVIEVYFVPAARVYADFQGVHRAWMEHTRGRGNSTLRVLRFRNTPRHPWKGYFGEKYAKFKLGQSAPVSAAASPSRRSGGGGDVIEQAQRMIADAYGVSPNAVHISIDLTMPDRVEPTAPHLAH